MAVTLLYHDGFDAQTTTLLSGDYTVQNTNGTISVEGSGRNSGSRLNLQAGGGTNTQAVRKTTSSTFTEFAMGAAILVSSHTSNTWKLLGVLESATHHLNVALSSTAPFDLIVRNGSTTLATLTAGITTGTWYYIELVGKIHDSTGYYEVWMNGVSLGSGTSQDTRNGGTGTCDRYELGSSLENSTLNNNTVKFDDTYFGTVSGSDHLGDVREAILLPSGAGTSTQFTPSAGSNYQNVDDATSDSDTTYNSDSTVSDKDTFAMGNLPSTAGSVWSARQILYARKDDAGSRTARQVIRVSGTDYEGSSLTLSDTYLPFIELRTVSPATSSAWTQSEIDGCEHGYKVQA